uniref:BTB domain-containing protein n=1 Tax=Panagrellus redivivus TaxID=6233 RepID=A0A7E5A1G1_PANRE
MSDDRNNLYLSKKDSDVTLVIGETELRAHRSILSEGSEYFQAMFSNNFIEAKSDRIILKETNKHVFKVVLEYIYTRSVEYIYDDAIDSHSFDKIFAIFACARYYIVDDLVNEVLLFVEENCPATQMLNNAIEYSIDELITSSTMFFQANAHNIVKYETFEQLTPLAVEHLLKHRLNTRESTIFEALVKWMRTYPEDSAWFPHLLDYIDLYLIEKEQLNILFAPTKLMNRNFCRNLLTPQRVLLKRRRRRRRNA